MNDDEQAINDLIQHPPVPAVTRRTKMWQGVRDACAVVAVIALCMSIFRWSQETSHEGRLRSCISQSFEQRDNAEVARINGQVRGLEQLKRGDQKGLDTFAQATENYLAYVAQHPLGTCK